MAAAAGGLALLISLWLPWFSRRAAAVDVRDLQSGWDALGAATGLVVAAAAVLAVAWGLRRAGPLSGTWIVAAGALALVVAVGTTTARVGTTAGGALTVSPAYGLVAAYAGGLAVLLAGLVSLLAYARERSKSA